MFGKHEDFARKGLQLYDLVASATSRFPHSAEWIEEIRTALAEFPE